SGMSWFIGARARDATDAGLQFRPAGVAELAREGELRLGKIDLRARHAVPLGAQPRERGRDARDGAGLAAVVAAQQGLGLLAEVVDVLRMKRRRGALPLAARLSWRRRRLGVVIGHGRPPSVESPASSASCAGRKKVS